MHRFKSILLVFNPKAGNEAALTRAVSLTKNNEAQLTVVSAAKTASRDTSVVSDSNRPFDMRELVFQARQEELQNFLAPVRQSGMDVRAELLSGTPFLEIAQTVMRENHDLVIMTAEGEGGPKSRLFGSTSLHLMRKCPCPIWVFKPTKNIRFNRILAAVDVDPDTAEGEKDALNVKIIDLATSLATQEQSELHVVQAWSLPLEKYLRSGWLVLARELPERLRERRNAYEERLQNLLRKCAPMNLTPHEHLVKGEAASLIPALAREEQTDLIVMGTVCRTGVAGFFIGSTAETILQHVNCSVLTVKPDSFVSPITF